jgi:hypothetical protein
LLLSAARFSEGAIKGIFTSGSVTGSLEAVLRGDALEAL